MRSGGLRDRIAQSLGNQPAVASEQARLIDELARALKETAETTFAIRPAPSTRELAERDHEPLSGMPQILKSMPARFTALPLMFAPEPEPRGWSLGHSMSSPVWLAAGIGGTVLLALLVIAQPFGWLSSPPGALQKSLVRTQTMTGESARLSAVPAPELSPEDYDLLVRSRALVEHGELRAARDLLSRAAADGSIAARFALAETFDPNMLAAWGAREPVADVTLARSFYTQAQSAGDPRAARRIEALGGE